MLNETHLLKYIIVESNDCINKRLKYSFNRQIFVKDKMKKVLNTVNIVTLSFLNLESDKTKVKNNKIHVDVKHYLSTYFYFAKI